MKKYFLLLVIATIALIMGCYYDNKEELFPELSINCDTTNVSYSGTIYNILNSYCLGCHGSGYQVDGGNIRLDNYNDVKTNVDNGKLLGGIVHLPNYSPMPKNSASLSDCNINQIKAWINKGAINN
ncbi:MAG: hypothetical protein NTW49_03715 [Bacteroidia bacterium]|nr:hypothetical protein [Bacteroidia bacterium]